MKKTIKILREQYDQEYEPLGASSEYYLYKQRSHSMLSSILWESGFEIIKSKDLDTNYSARLSTFKIRFDKTKLERLKKVLRALTEINCSITKGV